MKQFFLFAGILYAGYFLYSHREMVAPTEISRPPEDSNVVMYSLTTCGFCKQKARELAEHNIGHVEYFIDVDKKHADELNDRINRAKMPIKAYGTPIFAIYGEVIPGNPSIAVIQAAIARHREG